MGRLATRLADIGALRDDIDRQRATDLMFVLVSHDTFRGLVRQAEWSLPAYQAWLFTTLARGQPTIAPILQLWPPLQA
jgi:TetR/AcrR family transcriptional regulator, regulator of autoinduction and epiphytic fitness